MKTALYPPAIEAYMPAFVDDVCRIFFTLSPYSSPNSMASIVQATFRYQTNNQSALNREKYPNGIIEKEFQKGINPYNNQLEYYIEINKEDLQKKEFLSNIFYKTQIRFIDSTDSSVYSEWSTVCLLKHIEKPTLSLRYLDNSDDSVISASYSTEVLDIVGSLTFPQDSLNSVNYAMSEYMTSYNIQVYDNRLKSVIVDSGTLYPEHLESDEININYTLPVNLETNHTYVIKVSYETNSLYRGSEEYRFAVAARGIDPLDAVIVAQPDEDTGSIAVNIKGITAKNFMGNLTIRRTSSLSNFKKWEDIKNETILEEGPLDYTFIDKTVQSGVYYKYCAQRRNTRGDRGQPIYTDTYQAPARVDFPAIFLTRGDRQLKIGLNTSVSSYKVNVTESITPTLGSQYPYVRRNSNNYYKVFQISGLISSFDSIIEEDDINMPDSLCETLSEDADDETEIARPPIWWNLNRASQSRYNFTNKNEIYGDSKDLYKKYNSYEPTLTKDYNTYNPTSDKNDDSALITGALWGRADNGSMSYEMPDVKYNNYEDGGRHFIEHSHSRNIRDFSDTAYEEFYREKVMEFLYANTIKLFRSDTEGNALVKLTDISLTPFNNALGRLLYTFSATATEIDAISAENFDKYGICAVGSYSSSIVSSNKKLGQYRGFVERDENVFKKIDEQIRLQYEDNFAHTVDYLTWMRLEFHCPPDVIITDNTGKKWIKEQWEDYLEQLDATDASILMGNNETIYNTSIIGYLMTIQTDNNSTQIVIPFTGFYELKDDELKIMSISFANDYQILMDYHAYVRLEEQDNFFNRIYYSYKVGQISGHYKAGTSLYNEIVKKYQVQSSGTSQELTCLNGVCIETKPGVTFSITDEYDNNPELHTIGETEVLNLRERVGSIKEIKLYGKKFYPAPKYIKSAFVIDNSGMTYTEGGLPEDAEEYKLYKIQNVVIDGQKDGVAVSLGGDVVALYDETVINNIDLEGYKIIDNNNPYLVIHTDVFYKVKIAGKWYNYLNQDENFRLSNHTIDAYRDLEYNEVPEDIKELFTSENALKLIPTDNLVNNAVITIKDVRYIYHRGRWYILDSSDYITTDIDGNPFSADVMIDYYCEVLRGEY